MPLLERRVGHRDDAALAGRHLLVRVEAEHRRMPATADRSPVGVDRAQRLAGVLDDRHAQALEGRQVGRVAEDVHRQQRRRAIGDRGRGGVGVEVQGHGVDVGEHRPRALVDRHVGAGHERERARDDLRPVADADRAQRQVQPGGAAGDRARVRRADARSERLARTERAPGPAIGGPSAAPRAPAPPPLSPAPAGQAGSPRCSRGSRSRGRWSRSGSRGGLAAGDGASGLHAVLERVDERLPRGLDHVLRDADRAPHLDRRRRRRAARA